MELTPNSRIPFPYHFPSDLLGRSLNIPSSDVPSNSPYAPMMPILTTPARVPQSVQNPLSNYYMVGNSIPPIAFPNVGSKFLPPTSQTSRAYYVPVIHNIPQPPPLAVGPSGHAIFGPIGPSSQPPTSDWVLPQQPNIANKYLSKEKYNNPLYVPYPRGVTNQWDQPTYRPQGKPNQAQPPFMGQNDPIFQQFLRFYC